MNNLNVRLKLLFSILAAAYCLSSQVNASVNIGEMAPNFTLMGHDGKSYKLSDYKGKHVVLEWFNNECPYVEKHYGSNNMQKMQEKYTKAGVVWLSVISSAKGKQGYRSKEEAQKTIAERKAKPTAMLFDESGSVGKQYAAKTTPHMFVINPAGKVVYQGAIDDQPSASQATIAKAKNYVANALDASMKGKEVAVSDTKPYGCSVKY